MASKPPKTYVHKMDASELADLTNGPHGITIYWGPDKNNPHNPHNVIYQKYPAKVLATFCDKFGDNPKYATFIGWEKDGVVKQVLDWMLKCCSGDGLRPVKEIEIKLPDIVSAVGGHGAFGRFFKTAYLYDFALEYEMKHLADKLKRELEFQAKGKYPIKLEEIYDMANYFWQGNRDMTAFEFMVDSIARDIVKNPLDEKRKRKYQAEFALWGSKKKTACHCPEEDFCVHDDLPEMVAKRVIYFEKPENQAALYEEFGKPKVVDDSTGDDAGDGGWDSNKGFELSADFKTRENDPTGGGSADNDWDDMYGNQASSSMDWGDETNAAVASQHNEWGAPVVAVPSQVQW